MRTVAAFSLRHRWLVLGCWLALAGAGALVTTTAISRLTYTYSTPGQPGYEADLHITQRFGIDPAFEPTLALVTLPAGQSVFTPAGRAATTRIFAAAARAGVVLVADYASTADQNLVFDGGRSTWAVLELANPDTGPGVGAGDHLGPVLQAAAPPGAAVQVTGFAQLLATGGGGNGPSVLLETVIGAVLALLILLAVYGSAIAVVPLVIAGPAILVTFLAVLGMTYVSDVSYFLQYLVALIGLGVSVDYSLLVVVRWREERENGLSDTQAVLAASGSAGRAVLLSAGTVALGLASLVVLPVPFLRSIGIGGMLIPLVALAAAVTLLPIVLATWGPVLDRYRWRRSAPPAGQRWRRWTRLVLRHRTLAAATGFLVLVALALPALSINTAEPTISSLAARGPAASAFAQLQQAGVPAAADFPIQVLVHGGTLNADQAYAIASSAPGVWTVLRPGTPAFHRGGDTLLTVVSTAEGATASGRTVVTGLRHRLASAALPAEVGGSTAADMAFTDAVYGSLPLLLTLLTLLSFVILARALRSVVLAAKAVLLNLVSLGSSFGFMVIFWQQGHGSRLLYGMPATGAIRDWIPVVVLACLFGLSMDYEVFVLTRVREEYDRNPDTDHALVEGLAHTGRLVTCAALILAASFLALAGNPNQLVKIVSTALAVGILLDAVLIRTLLVPALVSLMGRWNWWAPTWLERPLHPRRADPVQGCAVERMTP